jgi:outer membrane protein assembly factor BamB
MARRQQKVRAAAIAAGLAAAVILAGARLAASQQTNLPAWPMLGHDPAHSGRSEYNAATNSGVVKWKFQPDGTEHRFSIPAIGVNGIIYVAGQEQDADTHKHSSHLHAISPGGTQLWALRTAGRLRTENEASPAVGNDGAIYVTGVENIYNAVPTRAYAYAVSANGVLLWESEIEGASVSSPTLGKNGLIYVGTHGAYGNGHLYAIEPHGGIRWKVETGDIAQASPAIGDDATIYVGSYGHIDFPKGAIPSAEMLSRALSEGWKMECDVYAIDSSGKMKWKFKTDGPVPSSPTVGKDGTIYASDLGDTAHTDASHHGPPENFYAIDRNGKLKWKLTEYWSFNPPVIGDNGFVYLGFCDDSLTAYLYAMTPDGKIQWKFSDAGSGRVKWRPAIGADGTVFLAGDGLWAVNPNGTLKWKYEHSAGSPVIGADGTVYATCGPSVELCAFGGPDH